MSILINTLLAILVIVSLLIILVTLMQRPKNEGLGAAFGGGMTDNLFGAQTTNVLATFTKWLGGLFFALTLTLSVLYSHQSTAKSKVQQQLLSAPKPEAAAASTPAEATTLAPAAASTPSTENAAPSEAPSPTEAPTATPAATAQP